MKALVAYGTKYGSTAKVAEEIASVLRAEGAEVVLADLGRERPKSLDAYDLVVVGSCINMHSWTKGARKFLEEGADQLNRRQVAMFACCVDVVLFPSKAEALRNDYLTEVAGRAGLRSVRSAALFGGEVDLAKYGFLDATMAKTYIRSEKNEVRVTEANQPHDFHDWEAIRAWARSLAR